MVSCCSKEKSLRESKNIANTAVTFTGLDSEKLYMDTPLHSSGCCLFLVILQNQKSLSAHLEGNS